MRKRVLLKGPVLSQSGYGVHARTVYRALKSREDLFDIYVEPINWGKTSWLWEDNSERREIDMLVAKTHAYKMHGGQFDIALLVTIPNEWEMYRAAPVNIGITAGIETSKVDPSWLDFANRFVNKIIVPSEFSKRIFEQTQHNTKDQAGNDFVLKLNKPIEVINYPIKKYEKKALDVELDYDFNFLAVAQWSKRKNIENTVRWFIEEFVDQEVGLVLKVNHSNNSTLDRMYVEQSLKSVLMDKQYKEKKCKVYLLHGYMNNNEIHSLYQHPKIKALLSLTHGEGFGLPLFEAAYCGLPVISHDWGGQTDFLTVKVEKDDKTKIKNFYAKVEYDFQPVQKESVWPGVITEDSYWAFPKQGSAKMKMREVYKQYSRYKGQAKKLQKTLQETHNAEKINEKFVKAIYGEDDSEAWLDQIDQIVQEYE
tara:strand:+ start:891 stop:2162 length:1272 start_codon:yes stop_codon:yes gene_type:complete